MTTAFWQQDSDKVILTFLGSPGLNASDVDCMATQSSLRAGILSSGVSVCDASLFSQIKSNTAYFGIKTYANGVTAVVIVLEKARPGEQWPTLFADGAPENMRIFPVICTVQTFSEYQGTDPTELSFPAEAIILVLAQDPSGWWNGFYEGAIGNLPSNFVNTLDPQPLNVDVDDPNNVTYVGRGGGGGPAGPGMGMALPGGVRGMGFGAGLNGELGNALKRRTQMLQGGGGGAPAPHRPAPPPQPQQQMMMQQQQQQEDYERQRQEQEAAAAAAAAAAEAERQRQEQEAAAAAAAEAERARKAAEADALAQELARKQMEAMQAQAAAAASIPTVNNLVPGVTTVKATSGYDGSEGELSFAEGDLIKVWQIDPSGWWEGECRGVKGWFPSNFVVVVPAPQGPSGGGSAIKTPVAASSGDVLDQAIQSNHSTQTLRHNSRAKGPGRRAPTMHGIPKIQTWDSTEQSPEAGAAAAAAEEAGAAPVHRPPGAVGIFPMPSRGGLPPRGGRGGGRGALPQRGGMAPRGGGAPRGGRGGGGLPQPRGGAAPRGGRAAPPPPTPVVPESSQPQPQPQQPPKVVRKAPAPPRPDAAPATSSSSSSASAASAPSAIITDPSKMTPPKNWSLPVPIADFCSALVKLMKSLPAPSGNISGSANLPEAEAKNVNARALAVCTAEGQVFVAGESNAACSAQGAVWPLLQAMLPMNVCKSLYANQPSDNSKVSSSAQNGCSVSGAIAACSAMIDQHPNDQIWDRLARFSSSCSAICGCSVGFDMAAYAKTKKHCDVAWGTGYAMKGAGSFANNVADVMDLFFQLSSVQLTLPAAARMAAALAGVSNSPVSLPSKDDAVTHMRNYGLINGTPIFGGESGLVIAAVPKIGGIAFYCPAVSSSSHTPVVSREFFKQLLDKYQL